MNLKHNISVKIIKEIFIYTYVFILFTVIGTVTHEYAHYLAAKYFGADAKIYHSYMIYNFEKTYSRLDSILANFDYEISIRNDSPEVQEYFELSETLHKAPLFISIAGPFQTILFGTIGLIVLNIKRKKITCNGMKLIDWIAVYFGLFWLREIFNLIISLLFYLFSFKKSPYGGDEAKISAMLDLPIGTVPIILGFIGLIVSIYIIFFILPKEKRIRFIIGGLIGGISGFILWMDYLGPIVFSR